MCDLKRVCFQVEGDVGYDQSHGKKKLNPGSESHQVILVAPLIRYSIQTIVLIG